ncbi:MAG: ABC transporter permease [Acidobacteriota bacterium]|nr:ABC transporter permease [Acidobacteriota bacterium]MDH3530281.1 ABC transporter permease [Acidobacteriota bacterium]
MWEFIRSRIPITLRLVGEHLLLTGLAVVLGILVAVPLGIWLTRKESASGLVMGIAGVIQTIPSLALLAFMIPIPLLGLSMQSAVVALFLYSLLPIVRNAYTGIKEVDADVIEAGEGMGLTPRELLRHVQLPLAMPTIMAGIRTATVISIGVATLAAFIGAGGLGEPIITGLQLNSPRLIMAGAVPAALLALLADWLLGVVEKRLVA